MIDKQLEQLNKLQRFEEIKPGLDTITKLLEALDNPHHNFKSVHIAGTNGKGSTAALISNALIESGYKTGLYTSPDIRGFNERIRIDNNIINDKSLSTLIDQVLNAADQSDIKPTYFEFGTALAFLHFSKAKVDIAIIEVGMGGLLDATNVITPILSIITNIDLDHTQWLGKTKHEVARRKAGIIKKEVPVITAETDPKILSYFKKVCLEKNAELIITHELVSTSITKHSLKDQTFRSTGIIEGKFTIPLLGKHQVTNATTALLALKKLESLGFKASQVKIQAGFDKTIWEGRLDIVSRDPLVIADGAHNNKAAASLYDFLTKESLPHPKVLILGIKEGKDFNVMLEKIVPLFEHVIVSEGNYEPIPAGELLTKVKSKNSRTIAIPKMDQAIQKADELSSTQDMILITGSLYLIADALSIIRK